MPLEFFVGHAYAVLFLWVLVEQLGMPVPSIPLLLTAGTLSATHRVSGISALGAVLAACLFSDSAWYLLGRRFGARVVRLLCKVSLEAATCVARTEDYFGRRGPVTLLFAKFIPGLSTVAAPIAGQTGMPYSRFVLYDLSGSVLWSMTFLLAGRFFGDIAKRSQAFFGLLSHFAAAFFIIMVVGFFLYRPHVPDAIFFESACEVSLQQIGGATKADVLRLEAAGAALTPITIDAGDRPRFSKLLEPSGASALAAAAPADWVNFYRRDDVSATAYFYLDRPGSDLPSLAPVAERVAGLK